jgi:polyferredoxin
VRVCPTGIDIRNGSSQLECIGCAKCNDACDSVMHELGRDPGLIRYDTVARLTQRKLDGNLPARPSLFRLRTVLYTYAILIVGSYGTWTFVNHSPVVLRIVPTTRDPFVRTGDKISNLFTLKIGNQSGTEQGYRISIVSDSINVSLTSPDQVLGVANGSERIVPVLVTFDPAKLGSQPDSREHVLEVRSLVDRYVAKTKRELIAP